MQVYLVGGAVRDTLLNRPVTEHDYVVVGTTPQAMRDLGFNQVGADFPVFLHPHTHDEYALARTERKSGNGYLGFSVYASPDVTLEDDLMRRDLTINAMAIEVISLFDSGFKHGAFDKSCIVDPYGGLKDIDNRQLHHVSPAFAEDPVRVLRLARFASRYAPLGFTIAEDTKALVRHMRDDGELNHLVAERVWAETRKALTQDSPEIYFDSLSMLSVLPVVMPTLAKTLEKDKQSFSSTYWQVTANSLRLASQLQLGETQRFALLSTVFLVDETLSNFNAFCQGLKVPKHFQAFGEFLLSEFDNLRQFHQLSVKPLFDLLKRANVVKDTDKLAQALLCYHVYQLAYEQVKLNQIHQHLKVISANAVDPQLSGRAIGEAIDQVRLQTLNNLIDSHPIWKY